MKFLIGVDEAGRGPLAGPVAVGLVRVPSGFDVAREFPGARDSKQLSELAREKLYGQLVARAEAGELAFRVCFGSRAEIDERGITIAIRHAIRRGVLELAREAEIEKVYLDGLLHAPREYTQETIIRGDELVPLISLASIAAKVARDRLMKRLGKRYPEYKFEQHKGYPTKLHYALLREHGPSAIHRMRYLHLDENAMKE
ncbi:MAG: ribonuclease HII [Minisyncoccia bacterium]